MNKVCLSKIKTLVYVCVTSIGLGSASGAQAGLIGDTVTVQTFEGTQTFVVGPEIEYVTRGYTIDVSDLSILVGINGFFLGSQALQYLFSDLNFFGNPTAVISSAELSILDGPESAFSLSSTADSVTVSNDRFFDSIGPGEIFRVDLTFDQADALVPAPATLALFALGLAGLGVSRRKKS